MVSLFTNIQHEWTITICTKSIYNQNDIFEDLSKSEFKKFLSSMNDCINKNIVWIVSIINRLI